MGGDTRRRSSVVQVQRADDGILRLDDAALRKMSQIDSQIIAEFEEAKQAAEKEHLLTVRDAFKLYPKAVCFSLLFSTAIIVSQQSTFVCSILTRKDGRL